MSSNAPQRRLSSIVTDLLLLFILLLGAYFRFVGYDWGEFSFMHPDERFLIWVGTDISPHKPLDMGADGTKQWLSWNEYFDTPNSPLNPNNRGHGFYVYGTLPMFITRYVVEWLFGHSGFEEMTLVGRPLSALMDLLVVYLVYLVAARLYDKRVGLLAAAFSALAVLQLQQAHFFTMDTFLNFFMMLAVYFAVVIMVGRSNVEGKSEERSARGEGRTDVERRAWSVEREDQDPGILSGGASFAPQSKEPGQGDAPSAEENLNAEIGNPQSRVDAYGRPLPPTPKERLLMVLRDPWFWPSVGFGLALGLAMASKISAILIPLLLPAAMLVRLARMEPEERWRAIPRAIAYLTVAAVLSLIVFRIAQPYAFSGPGFFGLKLNPAWLEQIRTQRAQATPDSDFPPAMQWARRPVWFSGQNLVLWGLGLPLGILAWAGFLFAGWQMLKGRWQRHALLWGWTAVFFVWQSLQINPTMRYQLPIYPMLAIFAGWAVVALWDAASTRVRGRNLGRGLAVVVGAGVLLGTLAYAYAFTTIYRTPFTRVAASRWIYQNIPGPINIHYTGGRASASQPVLFPYSFALTPGVPYQTLFKANHSGTVSEITLQHVVDSQASNELRRLRLELLQDGNVLATAEINEAFPAQVQPLQGGYPMVLDHPVELAEEQEYVIRLELVGTGSGGAPLMDVMGSVNLQVLQIDGSALEQTLTDPAYLPANGQPYISNFIAQVGGLLTQLRLTNVTAPPGALENGQMMIGIAVPGEALEPVPANIMAQPSADGQSTDYSINLIEPMPLAIGQAYAISLNLRPPGGALSLFGAGIASEGDWDDGLPLRVDGFDGYGGYYQLDLTFNMYWDDNAQKLERFNRVLDQSEYIAISSNRQWGSLPRIPERFPMTTLYYRNLLGCPAYRSIYWCYAVAEPGMFEGNLGYELVQVFQSNPRIGAFELNDQFAEEAFTVYDHPKVLIFRKTANYNAGQVHALLGSVDFSKVIRIPPMRAGSQPANLMLPEERWAQQQAGGTWSEIFNSQALFNRFPALGAVLWYISLLALGLLVYPLLRLAFPMLPDRAYPLARTAGLLLLSYLVWLGASLAPGLLPFTRLSIGVWLVLLGLVGGVLAWRQRAELRQEWRVRGRYFLTVEALFLAFFLLDLLIRFGNPDLWHPWKGGEKPMDFAYFNAVLKSTSFPPFDPWYAGGYLNYYYYGFMFIGVLVKLLGIVPAVAYNLALPTLFAMIALGAYSVAWNLVGRKSEKRGARGEERKDVERRAWSVEREDQGTGVLSGGDASLPQSQAPVSQPPVGVFEAPVAIEQRFAERANQFAQQALAEEAGPGPEAEIRPSPYAYWVGLAAALGTALLGNLGTVRMIFQGWQRLAAPGGALEGAGVLQRWMWAGEGFLKALGGESLPYGLGDWYWIPSRAIPAPGDVEPITEFPFFTVLYADLHAHLLALPITLLVLTFVVAVILGRGHWKSLGGTLLAFFLGGLAIGALRPTNTWDFPTYLALGVIAVGYSLYTYFTPSEGLLRRLPFLRDVPVSNQRWLAAGAGVLLLVGLSVLLFQPYAQWYGLGYTQVGQWEGTHTPLGAYFTHWGLFLFVIISWMFWETHEWLDQTPLTALRRYYPLVPYLKIGLPIVAWIALLVVIALVWVLKVSIAWVVLPLMAWSLVLLLRPAMPDSKRLVLFMTGTGLALTLMVEIIVLRGDIGRMNTVFKFYLQVWTLFAVSAAAGLGWLLGEIRRWTPGWRSAWGTALTLLVAGAALFSLMAGIAKVKDRMTPEVGHTLDGLAFMEFSVYNDDWGPMHLDQDYQAIRWLQENVEGSPVILEGNQRALYRWGSRITNYTGLPGVVGWEWHQQQQRALVPGQWVSDRIREVDNFYFTGDLQQALDFLRKYQVEYIVVGQQERGLYPGPGLDKFEAQNGALWQEVYRVDDTVIYKVLAQ